MPHTATLLEELLTQAEKGLETLIKSRGRWHKHARAMLNDLAQRCDLVTQDDLDAVLMMLAKTRAVQEEINKRLTRLESKMNQPAQQKKPSGKITATKPNLRSVKQDNRRKRR